MRTKYSVLALDGGGIRGIIPARVLQALEERLGRPVCELFEPSSPERPPAASSPWG